MSIFDEQLARKPDHYPWTNDFMEAMWEGQWTPKEFNFRSDVQNFKVDLTQQERDIVVKTLSAIGQVETAVKLWWAKLFMMLPHPSIIDLGLVLSNIEVIHNKAYEKLLGALELNDVFEENLKLDIIIGRVKYLKKYLEKNYSNDRKQFVYALILFTLFVENVSLFSQFYIISWLHRFKNVLKDTQQQVQYTAKEELIHAQVGIKLIQTIREEHPELFDDDLHARVIHEAKEAFIAESKIIDWIIGDYKDQKISADILKEYIKHRINDSFEQLEFGKVFELQDISDEYAWMDEEVLGNSMTDFFWKKPIEYSKKSQSFNADDLF